MSPVDKVVSYPHSDPQAAYGILGKEMAPALREQPGTVPSPYVTGAEDMDATRVEQDGA